MDEGTVGGSEGLAGGVGAEEGGGEVYGGQVAEERGDEGASVGKGGCDDRRDGACRARAAFDPGRVDDDGGGVGVEHVGLAGEFEGVAPGVVARAVGDVATAAGGEGVEVVVDHAEVGVWRQEADGVREAGGVGGADAAGGVGGGVVAHDNLHGAAPKALGQDAVEGAGDGVLLVVCEDDDRYVGIHERVRWLMNCRRSVSAE